MAAGDQIPIPSGLNEEPSFLPLPGGANLSIRQLFTVLFTLIGWYAIGGLILGSVLHTAIIGLVMTGFIPVAGFWIAFKRVDGLPYEYYLANKIIYLMDGENYILLDKRASDVEDVQWFTEESLEDNYY